MSAEEMHRHEAETPPLQDASSLENMDPVLQTLAQQIQHISQAKQQIQVGMDQLADTERSLATLIPALEIQIRGWTNEIKLLQARLNETESTYAEVVDKLDARLRRQQADTNEQLASLAAAYENKTSVLQAQIEALQIEMDTRPEVPPSRSADKGFSIHPAEDA